MNTLLFIVAAFQLAVTVPAGAVGASGQPTAAALDSANRTHNVTQHVLLVMTDGLRWQELYRGADELLMAGRHAGRDSAHVREEFWRDTEEARRAALLPFLWGTIAREGQLFGNQDAGSVAEVANAYKVSYPGYSEVLSGRADPDVSSNHHRVNKNTTVFEWLNRQAAFRGRVAAFATWGAFTRIFNAARSGVPVFDGWQRGHAPTLVSRAGGIGGLWNAIKRYGRNGGRDAVTHRKALDYLAEKKPRVMFVGYGETDDDAHGGRYDQYLNAAHQMDAYLGELWNAVQSDPEYRGRTTMIVTTDHGRGSGASEWRTHGADVEGSEDIWMAVIGPDTPAQGMRTNAHPVVQAQVAATVAALLGEDFVRAYPGVASPIADVLRPGARGSVALRRVP